MRVQIGDGLVAEQSRDDAVKQTAIDEISINHVMSGIEGTQRDLPDAQRRRDLVDRIIGELGTFTHEDRVAGTIGVRRGLVGVVKQKQGLPDWRVTQLDAVREAWRGIGHAASYAMLCEDCVRLAVEMTEWRGIKAGDAKRHGEMTHQV